MRLFIAEKPQIGKDIANALCHAVRKDGYFQCGDDYVTWCVGHIIKSAEPEAYNPAYKQWKKEGLPLRLFPVKYEPKPETAAQDDKKRLVGSFKGQQSDIVSAAVDEKESAAPLPFNLSDLQQFLNKKHKLSADDTLKITQTLRDKYKCITYNRSDCSYLSEEQYQESPNVLNAMDNIVDYVTTPHIKDLLKAKDKGKKKGQKGIGTQATRASFVPLLVKRGFVEKQGQKLVPTKAGLDFFHSLPKSVRNNRYFASAREFRQAIYHFFSDKLPSIAGALSCCINDNFQTLKPASSS